ncbi:MAG: AraC family transcriptional regulator [Clostridiaceae bacterium]|nr:AraC family transcriptional regulator [Clostridiaceae bacterium]
MIRNKYFLINLLSYFLILSLPLFTFIYIITERTEAANRNLISVDQTAAVNEASRALDRKFGEIDEIGWKMYLSNWGTRLRSSSDILFNYFDIVHRQDISNELLGYQYITNVADQVTLFVPDRHLVVNQNGWWDSDEFMNYMSIEGDHDHQIFLDAVRSPKALQLMNLKNMNIGASADNALVLMKSIDNLTESRATLVLFISEYSLNSFINSTSSAKEIKVNINLGEERLFTSFDRTALEQDHDHWLIMNIHSATNDWEYEIALEKTTYVSLFSQPIIWIVMALPIFLLALAIAYLVTSWNYKPIRHVLQRLGVPYSAHKQITSEFNTIMESFDRLEHEKEDLEQQTKSYSQVIRNNILINLLQGYFDHDQILVTLETFQMHYRADQYFAVIFFQFQKAEWLTGKDDFPLFLSLRNCLDKQETSFELCRSFNNRIVAIFHSDDIIEHQSLESIGIQATKEIFDQFQMDVQFAVGGVEQGLVGISKSYLAAQKSQESVNRGIGFDLMLEKARYYYPTDWEIQLINHLKVGNEQAAVNLINEIRKENKKLGLSEQDHDKLLSLLMETISRVRHELGLGPETNMPAAETPLEDECPADRTEQQWQHVFWRIAALCSRSTDNRDLAYNANLADKLIAYLKDHFNDPSLSMQALSEQFHLSAATLYRVFKTAAKINFYDCLSRIRIEQAKRYLEEGGYTSANVAKMVGYESVQSFNRAFLRYEGISPKEYALTHRS